jgi:hypothetical protein
LRSVGEELINTLHSRLKKRFLVDGFRGARNAIGVFLARRRFERRENGGHEQAGSAE